MISCHRTSSGSICCGVSSGGFTLELLVDVSFADAAGEHRWAVIDGQGQLADRSLAAMGECDPPRYPLLQTMREDASRRLVAAGMEPQARARLLGALAKIGRRCIEADRADTTLRDMLLAEHDTLRESIAWGRQHAEAAIRADAMTAAIAAAFAAAFTAWRLEAMQWLESCEALPEGRR